MNHSPDDSGDLKALRWAETVKAVINMFPHLLMKATDSETWRELNRVIPRGHYIDEDQARREVSVAIPPGGDYTDEDRAQAVVVLWWLREQCDALAKDLPNRGVFTPKGWTAVGHLVYGRSMFL